jgi:hypothetical protein
MFSSASQSDVQHVQFCVKHWYSTCSVPCHTLVFNMSSFGTCAGVQHVSGEWKYMAWRETKYVVLKLALSLWENIYYKVISTSRIRHKSLTALAPTIRTRSPLLPDAIRPTGSVHSPPPYVKADSYTCIDAYRCLVLITHLLDQVENSAKILMSYDTPRPAITLRLIHIPGTVYKTDINFNVILHRCLRLPSGLFYFQVFQPKSTRVIRHAQLMPLYLISRLTHGNTKSGNIIIMQLHAACC